MRAIVRSTLPPALRPGDPVRVIAPAGSFPQQALERGLEVLARRYRVVCEAGVFAVEGYLAGSDARRARELNDALSEPFETSKAVFAARGGYGVMRILPDLALDQVAPKLVIGFSDLTALHLALQSRGWPSIHGPVVTQLGGQPAAAADRLFELLEGGLPISPLSGGQTVVGGVAEGRLLGGNLSVLTRLIGTPYLPPLSGAVLLLEDVAERPYRLDRMWTHLRLAGALSGVAGIVLGDFTDCDSPAETSGLQRPAQRGAERMAELASELGVPCVAGLPIGHGPLNLAVPLGTHVRLDATKRRLEFLERLVQ